MICITVQKYLSAYMDRQLPLHDKNEVSVHVGECRTCRMELRSLLEVKKTLRAYPQPPMPPDLRNAIEAATIHQRSLWDKLLAPRWWAPSLAFAIAGGWLWVHFYKTRIPIISPHHLEARQPQVTAVSHDLIALHPDSSRSKDTQ